MGAARKAALPEIGSELREGVLQIILRDAAELLRLQAGKARRISQTPSANLKNFDLAGRVPPAAQLLADLPGLAVQRGASVLSSVDLPTPELPQKAQRCPSI